MANKDDNPTYKEAMIGLDVAGFIAAMEAEITILIELNVFDVVLRDPSMKSTIRCMGFTTETISRRTYPQTKSPLLRPWF